MRRQDGRSVSKLTNQTSFGAQHLPRNVAGRYCLRRSPPAWRIVENSMKIKAPFLTPATINMLSIAIVACAIFVVDTQVHVDIDVPVLYVAVVLMSTRLFEGRGILIVSLGCAVLTVAGYLLSPGNLSATISIANRLLSFSPIRAP